MIATQYLSRRCSSLATTTFMGALVLMVPTMLRGASASLRGGDSVVSTGGEGSTMVPDPRHRSLQLDGKMERPFKLVWPEIKSQLCPNMVPEIRWANTIFSLARDQLSLDNSPYTENDELFTNFFTFAPGGMMYISPEGEKTLYASIWKSGNDQIRHGSAELLKDAEGTFVEELSEMLYREMNDHNACLVTAVRDPVLHFLSGYNELETRCEGGAFPYLTYERGSMGRFEEFVQDILMNPTRSAALDETHNCMSPLRHVFSQSGVLHEAHLHGAEFTDYLPSIKNLEEAFPKFLSDTCPGLPKSYGESQLPTAVGSHESQRDPKHTYKAAKEVWAKDGPTARALCALSIMDYACFQDLPDGVPLLCQEVYSETHFFKAITMDGK